jgi:uncharacterized membrane protein
MTRVAYWTTTGLVALAFTVAGIAYLSRADAVVEGVTELGYPAYLIPILGAFKLLGAAGILSRRFPRLAEWAYAGIVINLLGAALSHLAVGHGPGKIIAPLVLLAIAGSSWALRPEIRARRPLAAVEATA